MVHHTALMAGTVDPIALMALATVPAITDESSVAHQHSIVTILKRQRCNTENDKTRKWAHG